MVLPCGADGHRGWKMGWFPYSVSSEPGVSYSLGDSGTSGEMPGLRELHASGTYTDLPETFYSNTTASDVRLHWCRHCCRRIVVPTYRRSFVDVAWDHWRQ
jgi:hypothetical protein